MEAAFVFCRRGDLEFGSFSFSFFRLSVWWRIKITLAVDTAPITSDGAVNRIVDFFHSDKADHDNDE